MLIKIFTTFALTITFTDKKLEHPFRLVFKPHENPIPVNGHGQYIWFEISGVEVIEIVDYH
jgi:hypothetical protein